MIIDALVLAGGRSSRLGGGPKAGLVVEGRTLLECTLDAAAAARATVVVGDPAVVRAASAGREVAVVRETPPFSGPAAAIAAGVAFLADRTDPSDLTLVLACDMPRVAAAVDALLAVAGPGGVVAVADDGREQPLVALYPTAALVEAARRDDLQNLSVRALLAGIRAVPTPVPQGSTDDIDTWDDAGRFGVGMTHAGDMTQTEERT